MTHRQNLLNELKLIAPFMLTSDFLSKSQHYLKDSHAEKCAPKKVLPPASSFFTSQYSDKLFWYFYIIHKGFGEYKYIGQKVFSVETEMKISLVDVVRKNQTLLKQHKISAKNVELELANSPWITITTFHALCIIYNISCLIIKNKICYKMNVPNDIIDKDNLPQAILYSNNIFSLDLENSCDKIKKYYDRHWLITSWEKPLLSISSYKLNELQKICEKLDISLFNDCKSKNKKELYQDIIKKL